MVATGSCVGEVDAWRAYIEGSVALETRLDEDLRAETGLSLVDYHVLLLLSEAEGQRLRMTELADRMVFSRSRVTYQVASMERRGLVVRQAVPTDKRGTHAVLTASGLQAFTAAAPCHAASVRRHFLDCVDDHELEVLGRVFTRVRAGLDRSR